MRFHTCSVIFLWPSFLLSQPTFPDELHSRCEAFAEDLRGHRGDEVVFSDRSGAHTILLDASVLCASLRLLRTAERMPARRVSFGFYAPGPARPSLAGRPTTFRVRINAPLRTSPLQAQRLTTCGVARRAYAISSLQMPDSLLEACLRDATLLAKRQLQPDVRDAERAEPQAPPQVGGIPNTILFLSQRRE
jgi:hypothetical protein